MSASNTVEGVVVWEVSSMRGLWEMYEAHVSDYIEHCHKVHKPIDLNATNPALSGVLIDNQQMVERNNGTGTFRPVRRSIYPMNSPMALGVQWQWTDNIPHSYQTKLVAYSPDVQCILEYTHKSGCQSVDLFQTPARLPYTVDVVGLVQTRHGTGFRRKVIRTSTAPYTETAPIANNASCIDELASSLPASCFTRPHSIANQSHLISHTLGASALQPPPAHMGHGFSLPVPPGLAGFGGGLSSLVSSSPWMPQGLMGLGGALFSGPNPGLVNGLANGNSASAYNATNSALSASYSSLLSGTAMSKKGTSTATGSKSGTRTKNATSSSKKQKTSNVVEISNKDAVGPEDGIYEKYLLSVSNPPADEDCVICFDSLKSSSDYTSSSSGSAVVQLSKCKHYYHRACIAALYNSSTKDGSLQCPSCKEIHGVKQGNCPDGVMSCSVENQSLPGFDDCSTTICITYDIRPGKQKSNHPNPGHSYTCTGFPRQAFLPDNEDGRKVLRLLQEAWRRRLTFTIGTSVTTGETNTVVWNEIHHKTDMSNHSGHGYPDPNYFMNVLSELAAQGVTEESMNGN